MNNFKQDYKRNEYFVTDMGEHQYLKQHGISYNYVKVIGKTTVYKYPMIEKVLELAKQYNNEYGTNTEHWVTRSDTMKDLAYYGIRYTFVKVISGLTVYKYEKNDDLFDTLISNI